MIARRHFLRCLAGTILAPAVVHASIIMPVSAIKLPTLKYVRALGPDAGTVEELAGTPPDWLIPCDGRLVNGEKWPDLFTAVRGYAPRSNDDWVHIWHEEGHPHNTTAGDLAYADRSMTMVFPVFPGLRVQEELTHG